MLTFVSWVVVFGMLILVHELGHFWAARRAGIGVTEFAIGFGPRLFGWQAGETNYSLRLFPLGGFVRLVGENPEESMLEGSFQSKPVWQRFAVIAAGPLMNFLLAVLLFTLIYFAFVGIPVYQSTVIGDVLPGGRAEAVGLQNGDRLLNIAGQNVADWHDLVRVINAHPEQEITIVFQRNDHRQNVQVVPRRDPQTGLGLIGISPQTRLFAFLPSLQQGLTHTFGFLDLITGSILQMVTGRVPPDLVGPVGIIQIVGEVARTGIVNLLFLSAIISINLGLLNILPIPALDGSKLIFLLVEALRGRPVDPRKESFIHFVGFALLILLMIIVTYHDLLRLQVFF
ncbi:MAG: Regulator of sigma-W protease RasP [Syntrophomonadaceae bacterium]|nr:Regulator of sigma-W protease RasP [Bacillota bacterium]